MTKRCWSKGPAVATRSILTGRTAQGKLGPLRQRTAPVPGAGSFAEVVVHGRRPAPPDRQPGRGDRPAPAPHPDPGRRRLRPPTVRSEPASGAGGPGGDDRLGEVGWPRWPPPGPAAASRSSRSTRCRVYRGMDIATAKPDARARAAVPHHLIDLVDPDRGVHRGRLPAGGPWRPGRRSRRGGTGPCWSAGPGSTCAPWSTTWRCPVVGPRWRPSSKREADAAGRGRRPARPAAGARPGGRRPHHPDQPPPGGPGAGGDPRVGPPRSPRSAPGSTAYPPTRFTLVASASTPAGRRPRRSPAASRAGWTRAWWTRSGAGRPARRAVPDRPPGPRLPRAAGPRRGRGGPRTTASPRRSRAPGPSPGGSGPGSGATPASAGSSPGRRPDRGARRRLVTLGPADPTVRRRARGARLGGWSATATGRSACPSTRVRATTSWSLLDPDDRVVLGVGEVRALCDRHRGVGADGVIRVGSGRDGAPTLSMDLRNADGASAEMSGNGIRCLAQAAVDAGLVHPAPFHRRHRRRGAHRSTTSRGRAAGLGSGRRDMGRGRAWARTGADGVPRTAGPGGPTSGTPTWWSLEPRSERSTRGHVGPRVESAGYPGGINVEFVAPAGPDDLMHPGLGARGGRDPGLWHRELRRRRRRPRLGPGRRAR